MIQGNKNSKLSECSNKTPEKSSLPKLCKENKTFPEKTKFTLQDNTVNSQPVKNIDKQGLNQKGSNIFRNTRENFSVPRCQDIELKTKRDQKLNQRNLKQSQVSDRRIISSSPFLTSVADIKSNVATARRSTTTSVPTKTSVDSKSDLLPSKRITGPYVQKCGSLKCKTEMKINMGRTENSKKLTDFSSGVKLKEPAKCAKSVHSNFNNVTSHRLPESHVIVEETTKTEVKALPNSLDRGRRNCYENGKATTKHRSRSEEVKFSSKESSVILSEAVQKKQNEGKILLNELKKKFSFPGLSEGIWETGRVILDKQEYMLPTIARHSLSKDYVKESVKHNAKIAEAVFKSKRKLKADTMIDHYSNNQDNIGQNDRSHSTDDYDTFESLERGRRHEERLSFDKRILSKLEIQIKETGEKTHFLYDSGDESGESISDIIHQLFSNPDDEELMQCFQTSEARKYPDHREECHALNFESKLKPELQNGFLENEKEQLQEESKTKDRSYGPKSRRGIEDMFDKKICQDYSVRTKSNEDSKIINSKQEYRTNSLSGDINLTLLQEGSSGKTSKERKTVDFPEDDKLRNKVSSSFFHSYKNVGFIGQDVDEEYVSFEPGQVTLYQPHEGQMLLYDIANCAATQGYLKMCGIHYDVVKRKNAEQMSPSGRVPFISSSLCIIPEFDAIVSFMQYKKFAFIPVKENDQPAFRAIISMIVDILETAERYICWYDDTTLLNYTRPRIVGQYPFPLNHIMHWKKRHEERCRLVERGYLGRSLDVILGEINSCFRMLSRRLGNNDFFFGRIGTEVDALVYGHVYALFTADVDGPLRDLQFIIQRYPNLVSFACNFDKMFSLDKFDSDIRTTQVLQSKHSIT